MPHQFSVHVGKSIDIPFTIFSDRDSDPQVVDTTTSATADCPAGNCEVGVLPNDSRILFIDGKIPTTLGPVNVFVRALGRNDMIQVDVLPAVVTAEPGVLIGHNSGPEYDTPAER